VSEAKRNWREDLKIFRERRGGLSDEKKAWSKDQRDTLKAIRSAMKAGPRTIPELAAATKLPGDRVLWYVLALKRYGQVAEAERLGDYYRYQLKETQV
jgi:hypothetical protein